MYEKRLVESTYQSNCRSLLKRYRYLRMFALQIEMLFVIVINIVYGVFIIFS